MKICSQTLASIQPSASSKFATKVFFVSIKRVVSIFKASPGLLRGRLRAAAAVVSIVRHFDHRLPVDCLGLLVVLVNFDYIRLLGNEICSFTRIYQEC